MTPQNDEEAANLRRLIEINRRRLSVFEQQAARLGDAVPPHVVVEIEDIGAELTRLREDLRRIAPELISEREPYMGLAAFHEAQADLFFGRDELVTNLLERVERDSFLAVLGASGSGKSSVVRAGLLPQLKRGVLPGSQNWVYLDPMRPGPLPLDRLAAVLSEARGDSLADGLALNRELATSDQVLLRLAPRLLVGRADARLVLMVDQAEELWTMLPADASQHSGMIAQQQAPFLRLLVTAANAPGSPLLIILTMRSDFLPRLEDQAFAHLIGDHDLIVTPMDERQLRAAIEEPAEAAGGSFEPGLVDELIVQTKNRSGALPLLEYALLELWKAREPNGTLTWAAYKRIGKLEGALAARADAILQHNYTPAQRDDLRQVLLRLVQPDEGIADARRRVRLDDLTTSQQSLTELQMLLKPLIDARLLVTTTDDGQQTTDNGQQATNNGHRTTSIEVTHDALIRAWPTLNHWISESRADLRFQLQLEDATREWQDSGQNSGLLWSDLRLSNAEAWYKRAHPRLRIRDRAFLDACRAGATAQLVKQQTETEAREQARQRELDQARALAEAQRARAEAEGTARRQLRGRAWLLVGALVLALIAASAAGWFGVEVQRQLVVADSQRLAFAARSQFESAPETALLLAYEAVQRNPNSVNEQTLRDALDRARPVAPLSGHTDRVNSVVFSPDGRFILTASADGTARLWDTEGKLLVTINGHTGPVNSAVFSPDGELILTAARDKTAQLWNIRGQRLATLAHADWVNSAVFSSDGQRILTASDDKTARLWNGFGLPSAKLNDHTNRVTSAVFSPDEQRILTTSVDGTARVWNTSGLSLVTFSVQTDTITSGVFSPDGKRILTVSPPDIAAHLWDDRGYSLAILSGHKSAVYSAVFSPDGQRILTSSFDTTARLWDASGQPLATLIGHSSTVYSAVFSSDGRRILTASADGTARLWNTEGQPLATLNGHTGPITSAVFSSDGRRILTASADGTARQYLVELDDLLKVAACHAGRGLTDEEIVRFSVPKPLAFDFNKRVCPVRIG